MAGFAAMVAGGEARAGAWGLEPGETLAILKYERAAAEKAWDLDGRDYQTPLRVDETVSLHLEHGLTPSLTLQARLAWSRGEDAGADYDGRGPVEAGGRLLLYRGDRTEVGAYLGVIVPGEGRNAGYAPPGAGEAAVEARLLAGRSVAVAGRPGFVEIQAARIERAGLPSESRLDLTAGYEPSARWLILAQSYAGWTDAAPSWLKVEASIVGRFGDWSLQAGWRRSIAGKASPVEDGPVIAAWRRF